MITHVCNPTLKEWRQGTCFCVGNTYIIIIIIKESAKFLKTLKHYKELKTWISSEIIQVAGEVAQGRTLVYCLQTLDSVHKTTKKKSGEREKKSPHSWIRRELHRGWKQTRRWWLSAELDGERYRCFLHRVGLLESRFCAVITRF